MTVTVLRALRARAYARARAVADSFVRNGLPPEHPEVVRVLCGAAGRLGRLLAPLPDPVLRDELERCFALDASTVEAVIREAHDVALQARVDLALLRSMDDDALDGILRVRGRPRAPCVIVTPSTGPFPLLVRAVARQGAPVRELPDGGAGDAAAWLAAGGVVVTAFDARGWESFDEAVYLGRRALLASGPWTLARDAGVPVVPATLVRAPDKRYRVVFGAPRPPDRERYLREEAEPFVMAHPGHYAPFLATCRSAPAGEALRRGQPPPPPHAPPLFPPTP